MLTVLHRHNDGTETLYEANAVSRENAGDATIPPFGDIILRGVPDVDGPSGHSGPGSCREGGGIVRISERYRAEEGFSNSWVFVMNRHGSTVARYTLGPPPRA